VTLLEQLGAPVVVVLNVVVELRDVRTGKLVRRFAAHNLAVDAGLNLLRDGLFGDAGTQITHCALGTSSAVPAAGQTALGSEVFRNVLAQRTKGNKTLALRFSLASGEANEQLIREAGLFTAGNVMYARVTPEEYYKTSAQSVLYTWTLSWTAES